MKIFWTLVAFLLLSLGMTRALEMPPPVDRFYDEFVRLMRRLSKKGVRTCGLPQIEPDLMYNMTVKPGERVVFNCKVDLSCMVSTIRWYHELENGTEVMIRTPSDPGIPYVHEIRSVAPSDTGMYTCVARNVVGRTHAMAYLQVDSAHMCQISVPLLVLLILLVDVWPHGLS